MAKPTDSGPWVCKILSGDNMRFPLSLTTSMAGYIAKKKLTREERFPWS